MAVMATGSFSNQLKCCDDDWCLVTDDNARGDAGAMTTDILSNLILSVTNGNAW